MPILVAVEPDSQFARLDADGVVRGDEIWPAMRRALGSLNLQLPCVLRVDLSGVDRLEVTRNQTLDFAHKVEAIREGLRALRVAFVTGSDENVRRLVSEYVALRAGIQFPVRVFESGNEADRWLDGED